RRRAARREHIPPEFRPLVDEFALDSHQRREIWWYILVLLMIDEEQVRPMGEHELAGRLWVTLRTQDGNEFDIIKPQLDENQQDRLLAGARQIWASVSRKA